MQDRTTQKKLAGALQDVRKMHRAVRLRDQEDPQKVAEILNVILREAIAVRSMNEGRLGKGAMNEIRNIRRDLVAGQIGAGQRTGEFIGKYSMILNQIDNIETETREKEKEERRMSGTTLGGAIGRALPSADMLTAALTTANPVLGYTTKIATDLFRGRSQQKRMAREEERLRLKNLALEEERIEEEMQQNEQKMDQPGIPEYQDILAQKLDMIREEIHVLTEILSGQTNQTLEKLHSTTEQEKELMLERERRESLLRREAEFEQGGFGAGNLMSDAANDVDGASGFPLSLAAFKGGAIGSIAGKILAPFVGLLKFFKAGGGILRGLGRMALITTAAFAIFDLVKGFLNAEEILGKMDLNLSERISAAVGNMVSGLLEPINWLAQKIGFDGWDRTGLSRIIAEFDLQLKEWMMIPVNWVMDYLGDFSFIDFYADMREALTLDNIKGWLMSPVDWVKDYIDGFDVMDVVGSIKSSIDETFEKFTNVFSQIGEAISGWIDNQINRFKESWIGQRLEGAIDFFKNEDVEDMMEREGTYYPGMFSNPDQPRLNADESPFTISSALRDMLQESSAMEHVRGANNINPVQINAPNTTSVNQTIHQSSSPSRNEDASWRRMGYSMEPFIR